ncbi:unnamed protein product [Periconia digitata]|uniref:AMP-dependent synthetase/ligase domain-containing protein n=1 Tax=Periconia digitata TaxID=1303443 RepID=A0A9W4U9M4_9PLEO|nr:unnamed protein product [Periconia digitata]
MSMPCRTIDILFLVIVVRYILTFLRRTQDAREAATSHSNHEKLADIEGASWPQLSVFEHIERGLLRNPNDPAVVCLMEQSIGLQRLVAACTPGGQDVGTDRNSSTNATPRLWCKDRPQTYTLVQAEDTPPRSPTQEDKANTMTLTYTQLHGMALKLATGLITVGVRPDTRMIMAIPNGAEYAILLWACAILRLTYVSLDEDSLNISGFTALKRTLEAVRPQIIVASNSLKGRAIEVAMAELELPSPIKLSLSESKATEWHSFEDIFTRANENNAIDELKLLAEARQDKPTRINSIMFTSGTSGIPKGCPQSVSAISHALHSQEWLIDAESGASQYALMQPHNSRGIAPAQTLQTWRAGGALVLTGQSFSVRDAIHAIEHVGVTFLVLTPPMVHEFAIELATRPIDVSCVKRIQIGGDAVTKEVLTKCANLFPTAQTCVNQGMTEGPGVFSWPFLGKPTARIPFLGGQICPVGVVAPGARIRLCSVSKSNSVVKRGELGELHISCPSVVNHYLRGHSETSFIDDGKRRWFNTGDMATMNDEGLVSIVGRRKDMIERAGTIVAPAVIESCLAAFLSCQVVVVAVAHPVLGAEPFAVVSRFSTASAKQIKDHTRSILGRDYALGGVASLQELGLLEFPVNATHKIIKPVVQQAVVRHLKKLLGKATV